MKLNICISLIVGVFFQSAQTTLAEPRNHASGETIKVIAFDAFPIFDPRPVDRAAAQLYPEKGAELVKLWRTRQFEYQWLRALGGRFSDFRVVTESALEFSTRELGVSMNPEDRIRLMAGFDHLAVWPDVKEGLRTLKSRGYRLVLLSNMTEKMLHAGVKTNGLDGLIDEIFSTEVRKTYKPSPEAYGIASESLALPPGQILFVAFAGWDVAGAKWFGYPTFWLNRAGAKPEELGVSADGTGKDFGALVRFLDQKQRSAN